jgi:hypothetical protein
MESLIRLDFFDRSFSAIMVMENRQRGQQFMKVEQALDSMGPLGVALY